MSTNIEDNKVLKMQKFVSQPTEPGHILPYCVAVWNATANNYIPLKGEEYATEQTTKECSKKN